MATTTETFRDTLPGIDDRGGRQWVYPRLPKGKLYTIRTGVAVVLLLVYLAGPFIRIGGQPLLLFNIFERRFVIVGQPFFPQDFFLLGLAMITFFVFIILFTVIFGRVWCGWACPQTVFMEMVFRKIEYWIEGDANQQRALDKTPWNADKLVKKGSKHLLFLLVSLVIAHAAMAYLVGSEQVLELVAGSPTDNWAGFVGLVAFTGIFYLVFAKLRELACTVVCPYGRLQSVLITKETIVVAYDFIRGEPRGKLKKNAKKTVPQPDHACTGSCGGCALKDSHERAGNAQDAQLRPLKLEDLVPPQGDCIDCRMCVQVCPTGIDIRNGTQLECVNCTACIDACDAVMTKISKPTGLIRFDSHNGITQKKKLTLSPRILAYSAVLLALLGLQAFLIAGRAPVQATVLRVPGMLFQEQENERISNLYHVELINKTTEPLPITLRLENQPEGTIEIVGSAIEVPAGSELKAVCFVYLPRSRIHATKTPLTIGVYSGNQQLTAARTNFLGPAR